VISRKATALLLPCEELEIASGLSAVDPWDRVGQQTRTLLYVPDVHLAIHIEHAQSRPSALASGLQPRKLPLYALPPLVVGVFTGPLGSRVLLGLPIIA
jgi:hypothetical protein